MKILIVIDSLSGGGAEKSTQVLCDYLNEQGVSFKIVCLDLYPFGFHQEMSDKGYEIHFLKNKTFIGQVREIAELIRYENFDLVHSILFKSNLRTRFAKLLVKFTHLESLVNTTYSEERKFDNKVNQSLLKVYKIIDKLTANYFVDHFHSITNAVKKHYIEHLGLDPKKISIVYRGRKPLNIKKHEKKKETFTLLNVARQHYQKGQIFLLKAMHILKEIGETEIKLIILGVEGSQTSVLKQYIQNNNLDSSVYLAGFSNNVSDYLSKADVFIFSSLFEGLGGALIEAQSAALPIIANDLEVLREVVRKDINGLLVDIKNTEEVVEAILRLKQSPEMRKEFARESLKNFESKFLEESSNFGMLQLYKRLC